MTEQTLQELAAETIDHLRSESARLRTALEAARAQTEDLDRKLGTAMRAGVEMSAAHEAALAREAALRGRMENLAKEADRQAKVPWPEQELTGVQRDLAGPWAWSRMAQLTRAALSASSPPPGRETREPREAIYALADALRADLGLGIEHDPAVRTYMVEAWSHGHRYLRAAPAPARETATDAREAIAIVERLKEIDAGDGLETDDHDVVLRVLRALASPGTREDAATPADHDFGPLGTCGMRSGAKPHRRTPFCENWQPSSGDAGDTTRDGGK